MSAMLSVSGLTKLFAGFTAVNRVSFDLNPSEIKLAAQLMSTLEEPFDPLQYKDEYREKVLQWIHAKGSGAKIEPLRARRRPAAESLAGALRTSIAEARKRKRA